MSRSGRGGARWYASLAIAIAAACAAAPPVRALPPPAPPQAPHSPEPTATAEPGTTLPYGSPLLFVFDDKVDSGSTKPGTTVHLHLKEPLVVNGVTLAPAGTPETLAVITTRKAHSGDEDGAIQVHLDPLQLPGRGALPVRAYHEYLTIERTAGEYSTRDVTDTIADVFIPGHILYRAFRSGRQFVLTPGAILRAETDVTIDARDPRHVVFATPPPFVSTFDTPHADLTPAPFYTPAPERPHPLPKGKPTLPPTPAPTPTPAPESSAQPTGAPT